MIFLSNWLQKMFFALSEKRRRIMPCTGDVNLIDTANLVAGTLIWQLLPRERLYVHKYVDALICDIGSYVHTIKDLRR